jgi:hypothetical protein
MSKYMVVYILCEPICALHDMDSTKHNQLFTDECSI